MVKLPKKWDFPKDAVLVDSSRVCGEKHVLHCIVLTDKAFKNGKNIAKNPQIELLLRLAGTGQVRRAMALLKPNDTAVLIAFGKNASKNYSSALKELDAQESSKDFEKPGLKEAMERAALVVLEK